MISNNDEVMCKNPVKVLKTISAKLQSEDRKQRKLALKEFEMYFQENKLNNDELRETFNETNVYLMNTLRDKSEEVREAGVKFLSFLIIETLPINDFYLTYVFPVLVERIGSVEIIEESEEIRLAMLMLLSQIISKYSKTEQLKPFLNNSICILCECVKDKYPTIKEKSCQIIVSLAEALPRDFHLQAETMIKPVLSCFTHQRYKVRVEGVKCIGEILMHSTYKAVDLVMVPMAEKLFDQIPIVRRTVAQVAKKWLTEYRDRYSYFHKILPLLLTGLNDEVQETREEAAQFWETVGLQYLTENEKNLKDEMDFLIEPPKHYIENLTRPNLGCRVLVQRNVSKIVPAIANELQSWQQDVRFRCSQLLCAVVLHAENLITMHLPAILPAMFWAAKDDDQRVVDNIIRASEMMGLFVLFESWSKLVLPELENNPHYGHITVLKGFIKGSPKDLIQSHLEEIADILQTDLICHSRKKHFQKRMVETAQIILEKMDKNDTVGYHLFKILLSCVALRDVENTHIDMELLREMSRTFGFEPEKIWSAYSGKLLKELSDADPKSWTPVTAQACLFEVILTESGESFGENLDVILKILKDVLDTNMDPECRLKILLALTVTFDNKESTLKNAKNLTKFFEELIREIFIPSLVWHAGKVAEAIRTMTAACLRTALCPAHDIDLFDTENLKLVFDKLSPLLLSLFEDAAWKSRLLAIECIVLLKTNAVRKNVWNADELIKIYPEVMKRLDDPTEKVRECAIKSLIGLFVNCPEEFKKDHYKAHHELIIDTFLIHFDDEEVHIQETMNEVLKALGEVNKELLVEKLKKNIELLRNQEGCQTILSYFK